MPQPPILEINALSKQYRVDQRVVDVLGGIDLRVRPGEFVSIVGPSGCGKSTLLRLLAGLDDDHRGDMLLDGRRIDGTALDRAIVFQEHRLFPWLNVEQNVALGVLNGPADAQEQRRTVAEHIALVGLAGRESAFPSQLSGGMAQRVAIARALAGRPRILLLDEPFGALDALTRARLQQELQRIWQAEGITAILVTHDVDEAVYLGDRVVVMTANPGRIGRIVDVPLARSRDRASPAFAAIRADVLQQIGERSTEPGSGALPARGSQITSSL